VLHVRWLTKSMTQKETEGFACGRAKKTVQAPECNEVRGFFALWEFNLKVNKYYIFYIFEKNEKMKTLTEFLLEYNIKKDDFDKTGLVWEDLCLIYEDYKIYKQSLEDPAINIFNTLMKVKKVHYVRYRIKNEEHVIEKIIRKKIKDNKSNITLENYKEKLTDLVGVRAIHLFKEDWIEINDYINCTYKKKGKPIAYYRDGDKKKELDIYIKRGCKAIRHNYGYRSIHYIIVSQYNLFKCNVEIQVRTIFEEAWSEIDHKIRYPYDLEHKIFLEYLMVFNRLAGAADEMGTFIKHLQIDLEKDKTESSNYIETIKKLEEKISQSGLEKSEIKSIKEDIEKLVNQEDINNVRKIMIGKFMDKFIS